jgi:hypothetical protein
MNRIFFIILNWTKVPFFYLSFNPPAEAEGYYNSPEFRFKPGMTAIYWMPPP